MYAQSIPLGMKSAYAQKLILIVMLSMSLQLFDTNSAHACVCRTVSPSEAFDSAEAVFSGQVIDSRTYYYPVPAISRNAVGQDHFSQEIYAFLVSAVWKGEPSAISYVGSLQNPTSCTGRGFLIGKKYLVYTGPGMSVSACSRAVELDSAQEDLQALGDSQPPEPGSVAPKPLKTNNWCFWKIGSWPRLESGMTGTAVSASRRLPRHRRLGPPCGLGPRLCGRGPRPRLPQHQPQAPLLPQHLCPPGPLRNRRRRLLRRQRSSRRQKQRREHRNLPHSLLQVSRKRAHPTGWSRQSRASRQS